MSKRPLGIVISGFIGIHKALSLNFYWTTSIRVRGDSVPDKGYI